MRRRRLRPFRLGLWLGVIAGAVWFKQRYQRSRQELEVAEAGGWSVVEPAPEPVRSEVPPVPVVPIVEPDVLEVGELDVRGEPAVETVAVEPEPAREPEPEPAPPQRAVPSWPTPTAEVVPEPVVEATPAPEIDPVKKTARKRAGSPRKKAAPKVTVEAPARPAKAATPPAPWVAPEAGGSLCPTSHPVKAKLSSKLFHLPGMFAYSRTKPDRCYRDAEAAEADGLQRAKR